MIMAPKNITAKASPISWKVIIVRLRCLPLGFDHLSRRARIRFKAS